MMMFQQVVIMIPTFWRPQLKRPILLNFRMMIVAQLPLCSCLLVIHLVLHPNALHGVQKRKHIIFLLQDIFCIYQYGCNHDQDDQRIPCKCKYIFI